MGFAARKQADSAKSGTRNGHQTCHIRFAEGKENRAARRGTEQQEREPEGRTAESTKKAGKSAGLDIVMMNGRS